ncbi:MAG: PSD1 and planctomycete cytochrome C domain-containing protein [Verrucomicrobiales bacterium]
MTSHSFTPYQLFLVIGIMAGGICGAAIADENDSAFTLPEQPSFNRDIRTIFSKTCFACHGPDSNTREAELRFDIREDAILERDGIHPILPGDAASSEAYRRIISTDPDDQMPPADFHTQLSPRDRATIKEWINQGAKYERHWAFIPPVRPVPPQVQHADAVRNPIDAFVIARLDADGIAPAQQADRRTLIRRVSLDLTGLPPSTREIEAFVSDPAPDNDAYEKLVDRLLDSPRFGEHQARYWLDAARYADTSGYQYDREREQWVWRDWVIDAFNSNLPFDKFTMAQTAGDLLPDANSQTRLATGFHRNHPITIEGGVIDEEYRTEYVMDRVVTTTTTWLGLTFGCARCHDHKYDPIDQSDFYSFFAFFNNVPERGLNGFKPQEIIPSPLSQGQSAGLEAKLAKVQSRFDEELAKVGDLIDEWEQALRDDVAADLKPVKIVAVRAEGGTELTALADGSVLASGPNPATQTYQINFLTPEETPTKTIRLEALTSDSLPNHSTGRAFNGNFVLSEIGVEMLDTEAKDESSWVPVGIAHAEADYQQKGFPITAAFDGKSDQGGWAVDGNTRFDASTALFTLAEPIAPKSLVRVRLIHNYGSSHAIGRFRFSFPVDGTSPVPSSIRDTLAIDRDKRSDADQMAIARYLSERYGGPAIATLTKELQELDSQIAAAKAAVPATMILTEMPEPRQTYVLMRGEYDKPLNDRPVQPDIPAALGGLPSGFPRNRLGLAKWLVSEDNPLTARVVVNRYWSQLFGNGIVKTIEDFGSQGEYPSHPELLDWLAVEFVQSGWDVKHVFKTMVMSGTYRQSSRDTPKSRVLDPDNRLLARGPRFRLDAETIRDTALAVSGQLDDMIGGPSVYPYHPEGLWLEINNRPGYSRAYPHSEDPAQLYRRSMYTFWKRTVPPPSLATFDAPEREYCVVQRSRTNTPLQAFILLHDPQFVEAARKLAERIIHESGSDPARRIAYGFELCTARRPTEREAVLLRKALNERLSQYRASEAATAKLLSVGQSPNDPAIEPAELAAYTAIARILMNLSEFITKG